MLNGLPQNWTLLVSVSPFKNRLCRSWCVLGVRVSLLVRFKSGQVSTQDTVGFLPSLRARFFLLVLGAAFSLRICVLPRPAKICLAFLRPALCARLFRRFAPPLCGVSWGFRAASAGGSLFFPLFLRLLVFVFVLFGFWCGHTFSNAPSASALTKGL